MSNAISNANSDTNGGGNGCAAGSGADTITLPAGTITLTAPDPALSPYGPSGLPIVTSAITLIGNNSIVERSSTSGTPFFRLIAVGGTGDLTVQNLTLRNGHTLEDIGSATAGFNGGGIAVYSGRLALSSVTITGSYGRLYGGAVFNQAGTATITNSTLASNFGVFGDGAACLADAGQTASLTITNSLISGDTGNATAVSVAASNGGITSLTVSNSTITADQRYGIYNVAKDFHSLAQATITGSTISGNGSGGLGNSAFAQGNRTAIATMQVIESTISGNGSTSFRSGINNTSFAGTALLTVDRSTISGNAARDGGAIYNANFAPMSAPVSVASVSITNSTISGNRANQSGGAIFNYAENSAGSSAQVSVSNSTITGNTAGHIGGGIHNYSYGSQNGQSQVMLSRSIVSGNVAAEGGSEIFNGSGATVIGNARNLFAHSGLTDAQAFFGFAPGGVGVGADIDAASGHGAFPLNSLIDTTLRDNGGATMTHALCISNGTPAGCTGVSEAIDNSAADAACAATDQRGVTRPKGAACDIGAFEVGFNKADLSILKTAAASTVVAGNNLGYTLAVSNLGPDPASMVQVVDALPAGLSFVSAVPTQGSCAYDSGFATVTCNLGGLAAGGNASVNLLTGTSTPVTITNTASVISAVIDFDPNTANNAASAQVTVTPAPSDTTPDPFSFTPVTNAVPGSLQTSNTITVTGIDSASPISITGGSYRIGSGPYVTSPGTVMNGQTVTVRLVASGSPVTRSTATLTIGGVSASYLVTTRGTGTNCTPNPFTFTPPVKPAALQTVYTSNTVTITGISQVGCKTAVSGGSFSINGAPFTTSSSTAVVNGDTVTLKTTSSSSYNKTVNAIFKMGGTERSFDVTTLKKP